MSYEEEFDKIIKQKAEQADFPFNANDWEKAAAMLDAQRGATTVPFWKKYGLPALIGVAVISIGGLVLLTNETKTTNFTAAKQANEITQSTETKNENTEVLLSKSSEKNTVTQVESSQAAAASITKPISSVPAAQSEGIANDASPVTTAVRSEKEQSAKAIKPVVSKQPSDSKTILALNTSTSEPLEAHNLNAAPESKSNQQTETEQQHNSVDVTVAEPADNKAAQAFLAEPIKSQEQVATTSALGSGETSHEQQTLVESFNWLPTKSLLIDNLYDSVNVYPNVQALPVPTTPDYVKKQPSYFIALNGGMHYAFGWETSAGKDGKGINYFGGIEFGKYVRKDITLSAGLNYFRFTNIEMPYYSSVGKAYGFGYSKRNAFVTVDQLNYLSIPINLNYISKDGIVFGTGVTTNYLLSAHSRVDSYEVLDGRKGQVVSVAGNKIYEGTSSLNFMAHVRMGYAISRRFTGYAELQYGLNDLFDSKTKKQTDERMTGIRVGLNYYLIHK